MSKTQAEYEADISAFLDQMMRPEVIAEGRRYAEEQATTNPNDQSNWWPKVQGLPGVHLPRTEVVVTTQRTFAHLAYGEQSEEVEQLLTELEQRAELLGYPLFLKGGEISNKHEWEEFCYVREPAQLRVHAQRLAEFAHLVGVEFSRSFVLRELLDTDVAFHAFRGNLPVTRERRYCVYEGRVVHHQPYWPPYSIEEPRVTDWAERLEQLNTETYEEVEHLGTLSLRVAAALGEGNWSIDWLWAAGRWYLIDLAVLEQSFVWTDYRSPVGPQRAEGAELCQGCWLWKTATEATGCEHATSRRCRGYGLTPPTSTDE